MKNEQQLPLFMFASIDNRINNRLVQLTLNKGAGGGASLTIFVTDCRQIFEMCFPVTTGGGLYCMTLWAIVSGTLISCKPVS